mmetsp:Transcript_95283/g.188839  ORF Transcript_95283/g.188839 Transcript_95283/m.188839 type:complete len:387 (-) Transcript_95283:173-1333(-)
MQYSAIVRQLGCVRHALTLPVAHRWASSSRRDFFQNINEQHLAHELRNIAEAGHKGGVASDPRLFDPKLPHQRRAPPTGIGGRTASGSDAGGHAGFGPGRRKAKPWLHYESLRGDTYPTGDAKRPRWQDLTHNEAQRLQEMYMKKRMLDRKILWLKMQHLPNPQKEAKMTLRRQKQAEDEQTASNDKAVMYPPPFLDVQPGAKRIQRMEEAARLEELESRFRMRIREQKLESARMVKAAVPDLGGVITDPIQRHINRRLVRQRVKIQTGLEDILTFSTAQILHEFMQGVAVSIVKVRAKRPRATQEIYYSLTSSHDPDWVQKQLNILAPKVRSLFAVKVNMGQTPDIRFIPYATTREVKRAYLWRFAKRLKEQIPTGGTFSAVGTT